MDLTEAAIAEEPEFLDGEEERTNTYNSQNYMGSLPTLTEEEKEELWFILDHAYLPDQEWEEMILPILQEQ